MQILARNPRRLETLAMFEACTCSSSLRRDIGGVDADARLSHTLCEWSAGERAIICKVENEHSHSEKVACGKLFPRKPILPGSEEVCEDPRRRELFRLWLARNCNFMNNFVPIICFATLANMDFQATITKFGVLEYMTKYMTKAGQGSLLGVMEHSFSLCMEKAREQQKGVGAAILKWFNLQSTTDVKSQLETMHLAFRLPRFLCTRSVRSLAVRSEAEK